MADAIRVPDFYIVPTDFRVGLVIMDNTELQLQLARDVPSRYLVLLSGPDHDFLVLSQKNGDTLTVFPVAHQVPDMIEIVIHDPAHSQATRYFFPGSSVFLFAKEKSAIVA
jgi:hypothetical protein